ncbi:MAG: hypothetical protein HYW48_12650 [Deltaproteobacteria bacterium]|nr:hypothetical protein [Deltaproteobacteria bacterium]
MEEPAAQVPPNHLLAPNALRVTIILSWGPPKVKKRNLVVLTLAGSFDPMDDARREL